MRTFKTLFTEAFDQRPMSITKQAARSPFGFGGCTFPLFATDNDMAKGLGTGFFIEGFDLGITAEHLMDVASIDMPHSDQHSLDLSRARHGMTALLPIDAVIFGDVIIPPAYCQTVQRFMFDLVEDEDPLLRLRGQRRFARRSDILFMEFPVSAALPAQAHRPRVTTQLPAAGDWVCAVGYPDVELLKGPGDELEMLISEIGMAISFARVTTVFLEGRSPRETAPVVFVESDWPAGMSGGPVFDASGRVVGVVSRELVTEKGEPNEGSFTLLSHVMSRLGV